MSKKEIEELESEAGIGTVEKSFNSTTTAPVAAAPAAAEKLPSKEVIVDFNSMDLAVAFPRRLTVLRIILFFLCTISTGGIYLLVASFYPRVLAAVVLGKTSADKATFFLTRALDGRYSISRVRNTKVNRSETIRWYSHRQIRYVWSAEANDFIKSEWDIKKPFAFIHANLVGGVDEAEYNRRVVLYGSNLIKIPIKNLPHHIISEAFHPFYLFQLFSTILWIIEEYTTAKLQRMSAIIQDQKTGNYELCVKGSPEAIRSLSDPSTIPAEFETVLDHYTKKGNYVLGLAIRSLPDFDRSSLRQLTRDDLERNLAFCGLLVFSNQLKPDSKAAIKTLNEANITSVIITGDNALTAITVAKEVGIIKSNSKVILAEGTKDGTNIIWTDTDTQADLEYETIERIIQNKKQKQQHSKNKSKSYKYGVREETELSSSINNYEGEVDFAITAKALAVLMRSSLFGEIVDKVKIWARVTPEQKTALVEKLIDCGYYVGMCGDGANDCGALRAAHVGLALSDAEASIVAPFTAKKRVISDMVALLKEGRCALTTSFSAFRYMALYPMVQLFSALRLYQVKSILGNNQYLYDDLAIVLPLSMTMLLALPYHKLTKRTPTASLLSPSILLSILGQVFIQIAFLVAANELLRAQSWFCPLPTEEKQPDDPCPIEPALDDLATPCYENTVTWTYCNFQYIITAVTMSAGTPFRMPVFLNLPFTFWLVLSFGLAWYFIVGPTAHTIAAFELVEIPDASFGWKLFGVMLANFAASLIWDWLICNGPVGDHLGRLWDRWWARLRNNNNNNKKNKRGSLLGDAH